MIARIMMSIILLVVAFFDFSTAVPLSSHPGNTTVAKIVLQSTQAMIDWVGVGTAATMFLGSSDTLGINGSLAISSSLSTQNLACAQSAVLGSTSSDVLTINSALSGQFPLVFEGATKDSFQTTLSVVDPTSTRAILVPDASGALVLQDGTGSVAIPGHLTVFCLCAHFALAGNAQITGSLVAGSATIQHRATLGTTTGDTLTINSALSGQNPLVFEGKTSNGIQTTLALADPTAPRLITLPDASGSVVLEDATGGITIPESLTITHAATLGSSSTDQLTINSAITGANPLVFLGGAPTQFQTTLSVPGPTAPRTVTLPDASGTVVLLDATGSVTIPGNAAIHGSALLGTSSADVLTINSALTGGNPLVFEGPTQNGVLTTLSVTDPTAARTITLPDASGTVVLQDATGSVTIPGNEHVVGSLTAKTVRSQSNTTLGTTTADVLTVNSALSGATPLVFEGATKNTKQTTLAVVDPTAQRTITLPDASGTVVLKSANGNVTLAGTIALGPAHLDVLASIQTLQAQVAALQATVATLSVTPVGAIFPFSGSVVPSGWLLCNGQSVSQTTYAALFAVIGTSYGGVSPNCNVPDLRGRVPMGAGTGTGLTARTLATQVGTETSTPTATVTTQPAFSVTIPAHYHSPDYSASSLNIPSGGNHAHNDGGHAHGILDPGHTHQVGTSGVSAVCGGSCTSWAPGAGNLINYAGTGIGVQTGYAGIQASTHGHPAGEFIGHIGNTAGVSGDSNIGISATQTVNAAVTNGPASTIQPSLVVNFIIKT